ncbi:Protoporphyrinogen oxidase [Rhizopogon vinicolor AM-OR11-026]|uniref:Protoporphyrinogen oxidase n=1 Tax=Rhizopogon vinicolor AM-OR11-026 TaxID=1314800 RepID=A0A1B7MVI4_9AGAM|nr:Protoporphyrinogen oxidase [Rhizopogon vinicolor AM-OR11-026]
MAPSSIAILGGGLTGLSAAFHLSRRFPAAQITLLNKDIRFGGWVHSSRAKITLEDGRETSVLLEAGPRTLRPNSKSVLELINLLDLSSSLLTVPKSSPAARNRFLCLPGTQGLLRIPSSPLSLLTSVLSPKSSSLHSPLGHILLSAIAREPFRKWNRLSWLEDESVDDFLTRRFGSEFARIFGSALVHGIYAADSRELSVRAAFPSLWDAEERGRGSVMTGFLHSSRGSATAEVDDAPYQLGDVEEQMRGVSVYSFSQGISALVNALVRELRAHKNVRLLGGVSANGLRMNRRTAQFEITTSSRETLRATHVVSAVPLPSLNALLTPNTPLPHLTANPYSSVTVVNLVFVVSPGHTLHPEGFGYLVPRAVSGHAENTILGCVFDSSSMSAQEAPWSAEIVKMTAMLREPVVSVPRLIETLSQQLGIRLPDPLLVKVRDNVHCIPLLRVGHLQRIRDLSCVLRGEPWGGRLEVIGAGVGGVSVGDCVEAGRRAGRSWA